MKRKKASSDPGPLELSVDVADGDVLRRVVEAAGGHAGLLATWDVAHPQRHPRPTAYNLDAELERTLVGLVRKLSSKLDRTRLPDEEALAALQREVRARAGFEGLEVLAFPVRLNGPSVGLLCLLHPSHAAGLLQRTPGMYNLRLDEVEMVVQNARLLERLLAERKWLEAIVSQNANGIAIIDADGRLIGFNPALERLSGWSLDDAVGHPVHEVFPIRLNHGTAETGLARTDRGPRLPLGELPVDAQMQNRAGDWLDVEASSTTLWDEENHVLGWALTVRDIRARKEKERLERIFLSGVSHELQTPIAVIKGFSGLLSDPELPLSVEQAREKAAIIHEESRRLERMVGQLLYATRIQAGGVELVTEPMALGELVIRVAHKLEPLAMTRHCAFEVEVPERVPQIVGDPDKIEQVLTNLIENAVKYAADCTVRVVLEVRARELEVDVIDGGPGVASEDRERIFHVFERGRGATRAAGAGLGLFICKSIVEAHGGRIGVDAAPDGGARFYFTLPRSA